jgi:type II secretory pathway pseudopilin PulG
MKQSNKKQFKGGFTIIELMLAMTFVAVLLVTVAFLVIRITSIYQKGITLKTVNQVGRDLITDFSRSVSNSLVDVNTGVTFYEVPHTNVPTIGDVQTTGAFCTGRYSYIWNTGYAINRSGGAVAPLNLTYTTTGGSSGNFNAFRLLRVEDGTRDVCARLSSGGFSGNISGTLNLPGLPARPIEMILSSESDLALYNMFVFNPTRNDITGHIFYSATFILATLRGGININGSGNYCTDISETLNSDFSYCAINKFNFAMRSLGEGNNREDIYGGVEVE